MVLDNINLSYLGLIQQAHISIPDNSLITLVDYEPGFRICVWRFEISSNLASKFTVRSGSNIIFEMHAGQNWGNVNSADSRLPRYISNEDERLTIQSSVASLDANVYIQYQMRRVEE